MLLCGLSRHMQICLVLFRKIFITLLCESVRVRGKVCLMQSRFMMMLLNVLVLLISVCGLCIVIGYYITGAGACAFCS